MKIFALILTFLALQSTAFSQFAVSAAYSNNNSEGIEMQHPLDVTHPNSVEIGLAYWFRLKNKRVEFLPELSYSTYLDKTYYGKAAALNFSFNTLIYPIDFHSDCNACPTFSKDGGLVKKGFYWIISPGISMYDFELEGSFSDKATALRLGLGAGLDIGVSNLLTISPFAKYNLSPGVTVGTEQSAYKQLQFGLRAILRVDKDRW